MSIRDLLARFRPSKASAEPVPRTDDLGMGAVKIVTRAQLRAELNRHWPGDRMVLDDPARPPPQHPLAPEPSPPPLDWATWSFMQRETFRRGWSFARFAVTGPDRMACVFGIVRGAWGIHKMDFYICGAGQFDTLNAVTHLPSGMGCGLFTDQDAAAAACDIAGRLADDWETLDPYADGATTTQALGRMHSAWAAAGITKCATHAHATRDADSPPVPIWFQDYSTIVAGKPEKLS